MPLKKHNHRWWLCFFHVLKQVCIYTIRVMSPTSGLVGLVQQKHPGGMFLQTMSPKVRTAQAGGGEEPRHTTATGAKRYPEVVGSPTASATTKNSQSSDWLFFFSQHLNRLLNQLESPKNCRFCGVKEEACLCNH